MRSDVREMFFRFLTLEKAITEVSAKAYLAHINYLYIQAGTEVLDLKTYRQVADLICKLKETRNWSDRMTYKVASMASVFFNFAARQGLIHESPMRLGHGFKKVESRQVEFFDWDSAEFKKVIYNPNLTLRMKTILHTLRSSGIRNSELCSLEQTDLKDRWLHVRHGKGDRVRYAPIDEECKHWMGVYLPELRNFYSGPMLFTTERYSPLTPHTLWKSLYQMGNRLGVKIYPHKFRHSLAGRLISSENGMDISAVAEILGHKSLSSTKIYTHFSKQKLMSMYDHSLKSG